MGNWDYAQITEKAKGVYRKLITGLSTKSWYFPAFIIAILLVLLGMCSIVSKVSKSPPQPTPFSHTEVAATIFAEIDMRTQIAATIYAELPTPEPAVTLIPTNTLDPLISIFNLYPCLPSNVERTYGMVVEVVDGDTIKVDINGQIYPLRYIGIDCPESKDPNKPVEQFSQEATNKNVELVMGKEVLLIKDVSDVDRYDRLLRYVLVGDQFINYELVNQGYAYASTYPPDVACSAYFADTQNYASTNLLGLWLQSTEAPTSVASAATQQQAGNCDPAYPDVCIPSPPPDLDCGDIPSLKRFRVLPPDPHNFDSDKDGIGCES